MERKEATERFNNLPKEHRVTIIANEIEQNIRWIEKQKRDLKSEHAIKQHKLSQSINNLEKHLKDLKD